MSIIPSVSVIIPVYNQHAYVEQAINSVLNQSYSNYELIIIDDASTDKSLEIIRQYSDYPKISIHTNKTNQECVKTFNKGISLAKGQYFSILASDDTWEPTFLEKCLIELNKNPKAAFCYTRVNIMNSSGKKKPRIKDRIKHNDNYFGNEFENIVRWLNPIPHHATVVRKKMVEEIGVYDENLITTHDWDLWLRLSKKFPAVFINEYLANYRVHDSNITLKRSSSGIKEKFIITILDKLFNDPELSETLTKQKKEIYARAYLDIAEAYRQVGDKHQMRNAFMNALKNSIIPTLYIPYRRLLLSMIWN